MGRWIRRRKSRDKRHTAANVLTECIGLPIYFCGIHELTAQDPGAIWIQCPNATGQTFIGREGVNQRMLRTWLGLLSAATAALVALIRSRLKAVFHVGAKDLCATLSEHGGSDFPGLPSNSGDSSFEVNLTNLKAKLPATDTLSADWISERVFQEVKLSGVSRKNWLRFRPILRIFHILL